MSTIVNVAHDKIYDLMNDEFDIQTANYHTVAAMTLPSVTVQAIAEDENHEGWSNDILLRHLVQISIRVHTSYVGFARNHPNSRTNLNLGDNYRVLEFKVAAMDADFDDSKTRGVEVLVTVLKIERHTQV
jgi:hypothetical protein